MMCQSWLTKKIVPFFVFTFIPDFSAIPAKNYTVSYI